MANLRLEDVDYEVVDFFYNTASPVIFCNLAVGDLILEARVTITTPFDDAAAMVSIGPTSNPDSLLATNETKPTVASDYITERSFKAAGSDSVTLKIVPGTSTQGAGRAVVICRRA